ncbi:hypothetical protein ACJJTC_013515 [Scirpophaga incertulas]
MRSYVILCFIVAIFAYINAQGVPKKQCPAGEHSVLYCPQKAEPSCDNNQVHDLPTPGPCEKCPPGEHSVLYCPPRAEPSCDNNTLHDLETPLPCDIPQCFCNKPTIRNVDTGECVDVNDCPSTC